jgi:plasmid stabilization system protein ParE
MNAEQGFHLHPGAAQDITDIWEFIAKDSPLAARRVREDILESVRKLSAFLIRATNGLILRRDRCGSKPYAIIWLSMLLMRSR